MSDRVFERQLQVPVQRRELYDWHLRDGAFERLCAPWETIRHIHADPVDNGAKRIFEVKKGGLWMRWVADHQHVVPGERFTDIQREGPFKRWEHTHCFEALDRERSRLVDHIDYDVPLGFVGRALAGPSIRSDIERMFTYRHRVTLGDLRQHARWRGRPSLRVVVSGASGLVGRQLVAFLRTGGHQVMRLVRGEGAPAADEIRWSVEGGVCDLTRLEGADAVVHLAGATVAQRWTDEVRREIRDSRVRGTRALVKAIGALRDRPRVFVGASGIGYYGDTGAEVVDEQAPPGEGFLAEVCGAWETETRAAEAHGCRTARLRLGVVLDPRGGALSMMLPAFKAGLGGRVGAGTQLVSWVGLDDVLGAILKALQDERMHGAVNVVGPAPVQQRQLARMLGGVLSRPSLAPAPAAAIGMLFGAMGKETALASVGARPGELRRLGYRFRAPTLGDALRHCLGRGAASVSERS